MLIASYSINPHRIDDYGSNRAWLLSLSALFFFFGRRKNLYIEMSAHIIFSAWAELFILTSRDDYYFFLLPLDLLTPVSLQVLHHTRHELWWNIDRLHTRLWLHDAPLNLQLRTATHFRMLYHSFHLLMTEAVERPAHAKGKKPTMNDLRSINATSLLPSKIHSEWTFQSCLRWHVGLFSFIQNQPMPVQLPAHGGSSRS